jgi:hypothetical protein
MLPAHFSRSLWDRRRDQVADLSILKEAQKEMGIKPF